MQPFLAALVLCWFTADAVMLAIPFGSVAAQPAPIRVVYACPPGYVCFPAAKDEARMESGLRLADLLPQPRVRTIPFRASDYPPAVQAAENRKRRTVKR